MGRDGDGGRSVGRGDHLVGLCDGVSGERGRRGRTYDAPFPVWGSAGEEERDGEDVDVFERVGEVAAEGFDVRPVWGFVSRG